jgi:hypothetical protein
VSRKTFVSLDICLIMWISLPCEPQNSHEPLCFSSASNRIIHAKDHASIQINIADVDPQTGRMTETSKMYAICGAIRRMVSCHEVRSRQFWERLSVLFYMTICSMHGRVSIHDHLQHARTCVRTWPSAARTDMCPYMTICSTHGRVSVRQATPYPPFCYCFTPSCLAVI